MPRRRFVKSHASFQQLLGDLLRYSRPIVRNRHAHRTGIRSAALERANRQTDFRFAPLARIVEQIAGKLEEVSTVSTKADAWRNIK